MKNRLQQGGKMVLAFVAGMFCLVGVVSVMATFPSTPNGEPVGGWLAKVFDVYNSGEEKLVVNSKNVTLPNNAVISENKQVTTKEYVDSRVVAAEALSGGSGGTELVCVADDYSNNLCSYIEVPGYTKIQGNTGCCFLKNNELSGAGTVVYMSKNLHNGDFDENNDGNARPELDAFCEAEKPDSLSACTDVHAFISVNEQDEIRDLSNCNPDGDGVTGPYECSAPIRWYDSKYNDYTSLAMDWEDMSDGHILSAASSASVMPALGGFDRYWTGSTYSLSLYAHNCQNWTSDSVSFYSYYGDASRGSTSYYPSYWMQRSGADLTNYYCSKQYAVLCACKE